MQWDGRVSIIKKQGIRISQLSPNLVTCPQISRTIRRSPREVAYENHLVCVDCHRRNDGELVLCRGSEPDHFHEGRGAHSAKQMPGLPSAGHVCADVIADV